MDYRETLEALDAAELSAGAHRFALWLFARFGGSGVCWLRQRDLAAAWRCSTETLRRYLRELEAAAGGLVRAAQHPRRRWQAVLLFAGGSPVGALAQPEHVHRIRGESWASKDLLRAAGVPAERGREVGGVASATLPGEPGRGAGSPSSTVQRTPHGRGVPTRARGAEGGDPTPARGRTPHRRGVLLEGTGREKQQQQATQPANVEQAELEPVAAAAAVPGSRNGRAENPAEVLRSLGLGPSDRGHREVLEALASGEGGPTGVAQHLQAAVAWAKTQRNPAAALVAAARGGYLLDRATRPTEPEKPRGIHDAPEPSATSSWWQHELENLVLDLESLDPWARRAAERVVRAEHGDDVDRALEAFCELVACVPEDVAPPCRHPGGIDHWRAWVDRRRETQRAAGAASEGVACA